MSPRILIVDDEEDSLVLMADILRLLLDQRDLLFARDGQEAVQMAHRYRPDLIIMDLTLPKISGWEATRFLKSESDFRDTPILALTAHAMVGDRERALDAGCDGYLSKPIDVETTVELLSRFMEVRSLQQRGFRSGDDIPTA